MPRRFRNRSSTSDALSTTSSLASTTALPPDLEAGLDYREDVSEGIASSVTIPRTTDLQPCISPIVYPPLPASPPIEMIQRLIPRPKEVVSHGNLTSSSLKKHTSLPSQRKEILQSSAVADFRQPSPARAVRVKESGDEVSVVSESELDVGSLSSLELLSEDEDVVPVLTKRNKKEKEQSERDEAEKLLKKYKKRIHRLVSCCIVPIGALTLLRRVIEGLIS